MAIFVKRFLYAINILTIVYAIFAILFSANSITTNYEKISEINYSIKKEYKETLDKYKKIIVFVLKNNLSENRRYFNLISSATYNLPPVKEFKISRFKGVVSDDVNKTPNDRDISSVIGCYNDGCIKVFLGRKEIIDKILKSKLWGYGEIETIPLKKATLLKISASKFLEAHKNLIVITLSYFFILYLFQSLFLFIRSDRLTKTNFSLLIASDKNQQELTKQSSEHNKLCNGILFIQEIAGEYFTHYIHQLVIRDVCIEEIDLVDVLQGIEKFFSYQIIQRSLKVALDYENAAKSIESDSEIIFIVFLNLVFKAIYRAKISSEMIIKIFQRQDAINIEINDTGYEYSPKLSGKIQIWELPNPILESLYQKIKIEVEETRKDEVNIISTRFVSESEINKSSDNTTKFKIIYGGKN